MSFRINSHLVNIWNCPRYNYCFCEWVKNLTDIQHFFNLDNQILLTTIVSFTFKLCTVWIKWTIFAFFSLHIVSFCHFISVALQKSNSILSCCYWINVCICSCVLKKKKILKLKKSKNDKTWNDLRYVHI